MSNYDYKIQFVTINGEKQKILYISMKASEGTYNEKFYQTRSIIFKWFKQTEYSKQKLDKSSKNTVFQYFFQKLFTHLDLDDLVVSKDEVESKFIKFFLNQFKIIEIDDNQKEVFNFLNIFLFILEGDAIVFKSKKPQKIHCQKLNTSPLKLSRSGRRKFQSQIFYQFHEEEHIFLPHQESHIQIHPSVSNSLNKFFGNSIKILAGRTYQLQKFRLDLLKQDKSRKESFINAFLFCGESPIYSLKAIQVQNYERQHEKIAIKSNKVQIVFSGSVLYSIFHCKMRKYKSQLVSGAVISMKALQNAIFSGQQQKKLINQSFLEEVQSKKCRIITLDSSQVTRALKNNGKMSLRLFEMMKKKITMYNQKRKQLLARIIEAQNSMRVLNQQPVKLNFSVKVYKSNGFRIKSETYQQNEDAKNFMSLNIFDVMTKSKQKVEKKQNKFNNSTEKLKQEVKIPRQKKQKRMSLLKKNLRMKKNKIETIAIKQAIQNTQKYRNAPQTVKFLFQDEIDEVKDEKYTRRVSIIQKKSSRVSNQIKSSFKSPRGLTCKTIPVEDSSSGRKSQRENFFQLF